MHHLRKLLNHLYFSDVLRSEGNLLRRGCIFAMCSYTPVIRNVLCAYMQCTRWDLLRGLYVCYVLLHSCDMQCTMCFMLCAEGNESIAEGLHRRLISPLSLTVSSPPVIYWMLSSKWTLSKNEIFQ